MTDATRKALWPGRVVRCVGGRASGAALLVLMALVYVLAGPASAEDNTQAPRDELVPQHGLAWNRTGLPLVFPLQVKTVPGQFYYLTLRETVKGEPVVAAFIDGGRFFRVLVPPGDFFVRFATGQAWHNDELLFGPGALTEVIDLPAPLTFKVVNFGTKGGHIIDLTGRAPDGQTPLPTVEATLKCKGRILSAAPRRQRPFDDIEVFGFRVPPEGEVMHHPNARFDPDRLSGRDHPVFTRNYAPYLSSPRFEIRHRPC
ncbi:MAG: hypothetical protein AAF636_12855 [Pseudomonadota bacterium]